MTDKNNSIKRSKHRPPDIQAYRFLQLVMESWGKTIAPQPEELNSIIRQLAFLNSTGQTPPLDAMNNIYRVMDFLRRQESPRMSELGPALSMSLSTATRMADILVSIGYVERLSDPIDRRVVRVFLTDRGIKAHDVLEHYYLQAIRKNLDLLEPVEQAAFLTIAEKLRAAIREKELGNK